MIDASFVAEPVSVAVTRMGQLQYAHAPHELQDSELDVDHDPVGHGLQVATLVAATTSEKVPPTHNTHAAAPAADHPPAAQVVQLTEPKVPVLVPASQARQADWPVYGLKFPRLHRAHVEALVAAVAVELVPTAQAVQVAGPRSVL